MPNHEQNTVVVIGEPAKIQAFLAEAFTDGEHDDPPRVLDFNKIVPQPANIETAPCGGGHDEGVICWYEWNRDNWGTKWSAYSHEELIVTGTEDQVEVRLRFLTAWNAPTPIFHAIEKRWEVEVNAVTIDEGGFPPEFYGDNVADYLMVNTVVEFAN